VLGNRQEASTVNERGNIECRMLRFFRATVDMKAAAKMRHYLEVHLQVRNQGRGIEVKLGTGGIRQEGSTFIQAGRPTIPHADNPARCFFGCSQVWADGRS